MYFCKVWLIQIPYKWSKWTITLCSLEQGVRKGKGTIMFYKTIAIAEIWEIIKIVGYGNEFTIHQGSPWFNHVINEVILKLTDIQTYIMNTRNYKSLMLRAYYLKDGVKQMGKWNEWRKKKKKIFKRTWKEVRHG